MAVTRSKRRGVSHGEPERRDVPMRVVSHGGGMSSKDKKDIILMAMLLGMLLVCMIMIHCSSSMDDADTGKEATAAQKQVEPVIATTADQVEAEPSAEEVIQLLQGIDHIQRPTAATPENDPNDGLGKEDGYRAAVFFESDLVDEKYRKDEDVLENGTRGGGCVEVYANEEDAQKRDDYLSNFDGTFIDGGFHCVVGNCVVRISGNLDGADQRELEEAIVRALEEEGR